LMRPSLLLVEVLGAMATVAELISYPVKGCAGAPLGEAVLTEVYLHLRVGHP
jgi:hypothetical protein